MNWNRNLRAHATLAILVVGSLGPVQAQTSCIDAYGASNVSSFLADLQKSVAADDRKHVASLVRYPITIMVKGKRVSLHTQEQLLKYYDVAFDSKVKGFLAKQRFPDLFCNWKGIMIGRGEIWFNSAENWPLRIIAINNHPPWSP